MLGTPPSCRAPHWRRLESVMDNTAYIDRKVEFELARAQQKALFERAWSQISHADLLTKLAELSLLISEGAWLDRDGAEDQDYLGYCVQMTGVTEFLRRSGIHSDSDLKPIEDRHREQQSLASTLSKFRHD